MSRPRIRTRIGQAEEGQGADSGKWFVELSITDWSGTKSAGPPFQLGPFDTEAEAEKHSVEAAKLVSIETQKFLYGKSDGKYHDMKDQGKVKNWNDDDI